MSYTCLVTLFHALFIRHRQEDKPPQKVQKQSSKSCSRNYSSISATLITTSNKSTAFKLQSDTIQYNGIARKSIMIGSTLLSTAIPICMYFSIWQAAWHKLKMLTSHGCLLFWKREIQSIIYIYLEFPIEKRIPSMAL